VELEKNLNSLENFKYFSGRQGFTSPILGVLGPREVLRRRAKEQEICCYVLEGDLEIISQQHSALYTKNDFFCIEGDDSFEIHSGSAGVEYLFTFKK